MAVQDTVPPVLRASDADRESVIGMLRDGSADGRLSYDTFLRRVDAALQARGLGELADLVRDLPQPARAAGSPCGPVTGCGSVPPSSGSPPADG